MTPVAGVELGDSLRIMPRMSNSPSRPRKMYIDIDGVLVVWDAKHNCIELSRGFGRLMRFCKLHDIQPYWLTTWSKFEGTLKGLNCLLWPTTCPTMAHPQIQNYEGKSKVSAVDFESDWVWIEDGIDAADLAILQQRGQADRFYCTDGLDGDCLLKFMDFTRRKMNLPELPEPGPAWESSFTRPRALPK